MGTNTAFVLNAMRWIYQKPNAYNIQYRELNRYNRLNREKLV